MCFSCFRIPVTVLGYHFVCPRHPGTFSSVSSFAICAGLIPIRKSLYILLTVFACSLLMTSFPFSSLSYPRNLNVLRCISPFLNFVRMPHLQFSEMFLDSSCARELKMVNRSSPVESSVLMFSFSNMMPIPRFFSFLEYARQSCVFLAKRLMDFVMTRSILPSSQSAIIFLNCSLFFVFVPEIPSSA